MSEWPASIRYKSLWQINKSINELASTINKDTDNEDSDDTGKVKVLPFYFNKAKRSVHYFYLPNEYIEDKYLLNKFGCKELTPDDKVKKFMREPVNHEFFEIGILNDILRMRKEKKYEKMIKRGEWSELIAVLLVPIKDGERGRRKVFIISYKDEEKLILESTKLDTDYYKKFPSEDVRDKILKAWENGPFFEDFYLDGDDIKLPAVIVPIFDFYIKGKGYGDIRGGYQFFIEDDDIVGERAIEEKAKTICRGILKRKDHHLIRITNQVFAADMFSIEKKIGNILTKRIDHQIDIIDYFIEVLLCVQDWENIYLRHNEVIRYWKHEEDEESKDNFFKWTIYDENKVKSMSTANDKDENFKYNLEDLNDFLGDSTTDDDCKTLLKEKQIICQYSMFSFIPDDEDVLKLYEEFMDEKFMQIFQLAIDKWRIYMENSKLLELHAIVSQMSHNLGNSLYGIQKKLWTDNIKNCEKKKKPITMRPYLINCNDFKEEAHNAIGYYNFCVYLIERFNYLKDLKNNCSDSKDKKSFVNVIADFNSQVLFRKCLLHKIVKIKAEDVELFLLPNKHSCKLSISNDMIQPFYVFIENYLRNVAAYNPTVSKKITCIIENKKRGEDNWCISLWEDGIKVQKPSKFYKECKKLKSKHKKTRSGELFEPDDDRGLRVMEGIARRLSGQYGSLSVRPVFVDSDKERYKIKKKNGHYIIKKNGESIEICDKEEQSISMQYQFTLRYFT